MTPAPQDPDALARIVLAALEKKPRNDIAFNGALETLDLRLADPSLPLQVGLADALLEKVRSARLFPQLAKIAERLISRGDERGKVRHLYAQALIDQGQIIPAIDVLKTLLASNNLQGNDLHEVQGLFGRAYKQIYVNYVTEKSRAHQFFATIKNSIRHYGSAYAADPTANYWHGGNLLALKARALRDGMNITSPDEIEDDARVLIAALEPRAKGEKKAWPWATLGEAYLALEQYDKALECFASFVQSDDVDAFTLLGTIRQLEQVWQLEAGNPNSGPLLAGLKAMMAEKHNGVLTLSRAERQAIQGTDQAADKCLESMFTGSRCINYALLRTIVQRAAAVCIIRDARGYATGTGFLVDGTHFGKGLPEGAYILTNAHVVSDAEQTGSQRRPLKPEQVRVRFDAESGDAEPHDYRCERIVWQSPAGVYDATLLRLSERVSGITPLVPAAENKLRPGEEGGDDGTRLAVVGHPNGNELSVQLSGDILDTNGTLMDLGPRTLLTDQPVYLHYKTPTQPGNSGSPVFETQNWTLVGLHRAGFNSHTGRPRLGGKIGFHYANEGVCIHSICSAIKQAL